MAAVVATQPTASAGDGAARAAAAEAAVEAALSSPVQPPKKERRSRHVPVLPSGKPVDLGYGVTAPVPGEMAKYNRTRKGNKRSSITDTKMRTLASSGPWGHLLPPPRAKDTKKRDASGALPNFDLSFAVGTVPWSNPRDLPMGTAHFTKSSVKVKSVVSQGERRSGLKPLKGKSGKGTGVIGTGSPLNTPAWKRKDLRPPSAADVRKREERRRKDVLEHGWKGAEGYGRLNWEGATIGRPLTANFSDKPADALLANPLIDELWGHGGRRIVPRPTAKPRVPVLKGDHLPAVPRAAELGISLNMATAPFIATPIPQYLLERKAELADGVLFDFVRMSTQSLPDLGLERDDDDRPAWTVQSQVNLDAEEGQDGGLNASFQAQEDAAAAGEPHPVLSKLLAKFDELDTEKQGSLDAKHLGQMLHSSQGWAWSSFGDHGHEVHPKMRKKHSEQLLQHVKKNKSLGRKHFESWFHGLHQDVSPAMQAAALRGDLSSVTRKAGNSEHVQRRTKQASIHREQVGEFKRGEKTKVTRGGDEQAVTTVKHVDKPAVGTRYKLGGVWVEEQNDGRTDFGGER